MLKLTNRFQKRLAFDIADCTADFYNRNGIFLRGLLPVKFRFDFVCNMRNDLYGTAAVISMTFLVQNRPVNFTRCNVGILIQAFIDKPFVMSQIQVCLRAIICYKYLSVLDRIHRTGIHIDIGIQLLHGHMISSRFEQPSQRSCGNSFSKTGHNAAGHKYIFYAHALLLAALQQHFLLSVCRS